MFSAKEKVEQIHPLRKLIKSFVGDLTPQFITKYGTRCVNGPIFVNIDTEEEKDLSEYCFDYIKRNKKEIYSKFVRDIFKGEVKFSPNCNNSPQLDSKGENEACSEITKLITNTTFLCREISVSWYRHFDINIYFVIDKEGNNSIDIINFSHKQGKSSRNFRIHGDDHPDGKLTQEVIDNSIKEITDIMLSYDHEISIIEVECHLYLNYPFTLVKSAKKSSAENKNEEVELMENILEGMRISIGDIILYRCGNYLLAAIQWGKEENKIEKKEGEKEERRPTYIREMKKIRAILDKTSRGEKKLEEEKKLVIPPNNVLLLYIRDTLPMVREENPEMTDEEVNEYIRIKWKILGDKEKEKYKKALEKEKKIYDEQIKTKEKKKKKKKREED